MNNKMYEVVLNNSFYDGDGYLITKEEVVFRSCDKTSAETFINKYSYINGRTNNNYMYFWLELRIVEFDQPSKGFKSFLDWVDKYKIQITHMECGFPREGEEEEY